MLLGGTRVPHNRGYSLGVGARREACTVDRLGPRPLLARPVERAIRPRAARSAARRHTIVAQSVRLDRYARTHRALLLRGLDRQQDRQALLRRVLQPA